MYFLKSVEEALKRGELSVDLLNAVVHHDSLGWRMTSARKAHIDEFGDQIKRGEDYHRRESGSEVVDVLGCLSARWTKFCVCSLTGTTGDWRWQSSS